MGNNDIKTKAAIDMLTRMMETIEKDARAEIAEKEKDETAYISKDRFMAGRVYEISLSWDHFQADPAQNFEGLNEVTCFYELKGVLLSPENSHRYREKTDVELLFLTKEIFQNDIVPALRVWAQDKVDNEPFGGFFGSDFRISVTLSTSREVREDNPPHMQGNSWEQEHIRVRDEKRIGQFRQMVCGFIAGEEYKTEDIEAIGSSLPRICACAVEDFLEKFGREKLELFFGVLLEKAKAARFDTALSDLENGFADVAYALTSTENGHTPTEDELDLACKLCLWSLQNEMDKFQTNWERHYLRAASNLGYRPAKDILKFGTGKILKDIIQYKDKSVNCSANDIEKIVDIKIKFEHALTSVSFAEDFAGVCTGENKAKIEAFIQ